MVVRLADSPVHSAHASSIRSMTTRTDGFAGSSAGCTLFNARCAPSRVVARGALAVTRGAELGPEGEALPLGPHITHGDLLVEWAHR